MIRNVAKYLLANIGLELRRNESIGFNKLAHLSVPKKDWEFRGKKIYLKLLDIVVSDIESPVIQGYAFAKIIGTVGGGKFFYDNEGRLRLTIKGVNFFINFTDELFVIKEVFVLGDYNFMSSEAIVVIDIGGNIGATSLFFSIKDNVKKIYTYELFEPTFNAANRNFSINSTDKIFCQNVGLGKENSQLRLEYSPSNKARMGLNGLPLKEQFNDVVEMEVTLVDVADEVLRIDQLEPGVKKICKMDCEGAEFEILGRLFQRKIIALIDFYIIEWHDRSTDEIESKFLEAGFDVMKSTFENSNTGLIYAFKK